MSLYRAVIPLAPVSKKNSQRILYNRKRGVHFIAPSAAYERYEREAILLLPPVHPLNGISDRAGRGDLIRVSISQPVTVRCRFYMPTKRRVDLVNLLEAIDDVLVKGGILADDHSGIIVSHDGSRVLYDKANPRTEIEIEGAL